MTSASIYCRDCCWRGHETALVGVSGGGEGIQPNRCPHCQGGTFMAAPMPMRPKCVPPVEDLRAALCRGCER